MTNFLISYIILFISSISLCYGCGKDWTRLGAHCYHLNETIMSYEEANIKCKSFGSEIVSVRNHFQNQMIADLLYNTWNKKVDIWLSARRLKNTNYDQWVWGDLSEICYFNWAPNQPNTNGPQYCIQMVKEYTVYYKWPAGSWNDVKCDEKAAVLCQQSPGIVTHLVTTTPNNSKNNDNKENASHWDNNQLVIGVITMASIVIMAILLSFAFFLLGHHIREESPEVDSSCFSFRLARKKIRSKRANVL